VAPQLAWASDATLEEKVAQGDWDAALRIVDAQKSTKQIDRDVLNRRKAVMLTGKAMTLFESQFDQAKAAAIEANRLQPEFVPAAVIAARAYFRGDELRRGSKILEHVWKRNPHPEVAHAYVFARPGNSTHDRLQRAQKLQALRTNNVESSLVVARAALDAREFHLAREQAETALRLEPRESVYLLLADVEEADVRNQGKIREYLSKAVRAQRDPAWTADGMIFDTWAPVSPISGRFDVFEWKTPVERAAPVIEDHRDLAEQEPEQAEIHPAIVSLPVAVGAPPPTVVDATQPVAEAEIEPSVVEEPAPVKAVVEAEPEHEVTSAEEAFAASEADRSIDDAQPVEDDDKPIALTRLPDDPGVADDEKKEPARFRLF
ncbi:heme biosynthesis protein HemY, partial [Tianweitania sp.]|uniref:heme biosynthesis protein HemY n=1 Tax=Tianweitania sp. TaxID=2021634 RepID=UPI00289F8826